MTVAELEEPEVTADGVKGLVVSSASVLRGA